METKTIQFIRRGELVSLGNVPPTRTLLEVLREDLSCTGTKEGCGEGDCGACTVVLGEAEDGKLTYRAINSCIRLAHSIDGMALWTVEDLAADDGMLHPAQEAMVHCHGSQCGFCTPGFVMSLFGMYQNHIAPTLVTACTSLPPEGAGLAWGGPALAAGAPTLATACAALPAEGTGAPGGGPSAHRAVANPITRELAVEELSGNLCRCTGYRPILDAAQTMAHWPAVPIDEANLLQQLKQIAPQARGLQADSSYFSPTTLAQLLSARAAHPDAQIVAGCTDVGLWVTKMHMQFDKVLDVTQVKELRRIERYDHHVAIGAAVPLTDAFAALVEDRPQLKTFANRFAGLPVRNSGTMGGNVANGSPIGDSMPLLIALGANVVLMSERNGKIGHREMPLEQLYTGYRKNVIAPDEVLAWIKVPLPGMEVPSATPASVRAADVRRAGPPQASTAPSGGSAVREATSVGVEFLRAYKISKRYDDDISAVCLVLNLRISRGRVDHVSIGAGGVAAMPMRAVQTEAALRGQPWALATVKQATATLRGEFQPISDMRASSAYRSEVLGNLMQRFWLESQGLRQINLESFDAKELA
ncbi:MAG: FAD binding domain-containing protein [Polaromonas sp.]|uniref:xanthine dehydrogenase small subunit n=1 Tax=Polaromonas sp. TaxID=1869339 RepID=UPI002734F234|nr:FAD binding domain-containing protein [Polaromonas sp.]MDP3795689.1 FAD binding domain-containing protein [Polaromonas sp.]